VRRRHGEGLLWRRVADHLSIRACCCSLLRAVVREKEEGRRKEEGEREKKRKGRKRKEKNMENFPNLKIFWEKNKRQFMKLVKKLFCTRKE
jgi:hypothetical protein